MTKSEEHATIISRIGNLSVIRLPGRKYPAIAMQGDSFAELARRLAMIVERVSSLSDVPLKEEANSLLSDFLAIRDAYEDALRMNQIDLPYGDR